MDNFEIYGQLSIDYGQLSMYGQLSIWTIVHDGQLIVHAWTIVHGPLWTIVHTMDNCPLSMSMYTTFVLLVERIIPPSVQNGTDYPFHQWNG